MPLILFNFFLLFLIDQFVALSKSTGAKIVFDFPIMPIPSQLNTSSISDDLPILCHEEKLHRTKRLKTGQKSFLVVNQIFHEEASKLKAQKTTWFSINHTENVVRTLYFCIHDNLFCNFLFHDDIGVLDKCMRLADRTLTVEKLTN